jgi:outer membrane lipoprotein-sorting protein
MKAKIIHRTVLSLLFLFAGLMYISAQDALDILKKMDAVMYSPKDMQSKTKIVLIDKANKEKVREATMMQKGTDKRITRFTSPASQAGIAVLSLPNDVMYVYMPAFGKERRIASHVKNQKFAGTDFSYDDMEAKAYVDKYNGTLLKTDGESYLLNLVPKSPKSEYSKVIMKVHKTNLYPSFMEYYDKGNNKIKEASYTFKKIGNYWNAEKIVMTDLKKNHKTRMEMSDVKYDQNLSDDEFTVRKLKQ